MNRFKLLHSTFLMIGLLRSARNDIHRLSCDSAVEHQNIWLILQLLQFLFPLDCIGHRPVYHCLYLSRALQKRLMAGRNSRLFGENHSRFMH